jgi:glycosyltransferase involved in cell wall biosynthesis
VTDARRVLHVISGLGTGGAETMLSRLVAGTDRERYLPSVLTLRGGPMAAELEKIGVEVFDAGLTGALRLVAAIRAISERARALRPHVVQGWMNHGNLAAWHAANSLRRRPVLIWGVRQSLYDVRLEKLPTRLVIRAGALLSKTPEVILFNSALAVAQHRKAGFRNARMEVIPNGFDLGSFRADGARRSATRALLGFEADAEIIGIVGRAHSMKDYPTFFAAMAEVLRERPGARAVAVGSGVPELATMVERVLPPALRSRVSLLPEQRSLETLYPAMDILCSTSLHGEGFPNVVAEAMACEVPCVVTDVGDAATVVGNTGAVVPRGDAAGVAGAVLHLLASGPAARIAQGRAARARIESQYSIGRVVSRYQQLYDSLLDTDERS